MNTRRYLVVWTDVDETTGSQDWPDLASATDHYQRLRGRDDVARVELSEILASSDVPSMVDLASIA